MEDFWYHNKSVSAPISLSQCGYELSGKGFLEVEAQHFELIEHDIFFFFKVKK